MIEIAALKLGNRWGGVGGGLLTRPAQRAAESNGFPDEGVEKMMRQRAAH